MSSEPSRGALVVIIKAWVTRGRGRESRPAPARRLAQAESAAACVRNSMSRSLGFGKFIALYVPGWLPRRNAQPRREGNRNIIFVPLGPTRNHLSLQSDAPTRNEFICLETLKVSKSPSNDNWLMIQGATRLHEARLGSTHYCKNSLSHNVYVYTP